jgi:prepilin-type N-terminal cleavage/methylation domain-containing protein
MKKKGFTLIEIMITLALFSLFVGFLYNAYFSQFKENNSFNTRLNLKYNGDKAMNLIVNELRNNVNLNISLINGNHINKISATNDEGVTDIIIDLASGAESSNLTLTSQNTLVDARTEVPMILCKDIFITMQYEGELVIITINLQSKNDSYTVSSAVNINK